MTERLSKFLARAGVCSRRQAEVYITAGRVTVNGTPVTTLGTLVPENAKVMVDGSPIRPQETTRIWLYYKPAGLIVSHGDPEGRQTIFDALREKGLPRVISVGRLDLNSEGLLILTNNGDFARHAELPKTGWQRLYRVRVYGELTEDRVAPLREGCTIDGVHYQPVHLDLPAHLPQGIKNHWLTMTLTEGKNREIRKLMEHVGLRVNRLIRLAYGPFELGSLKPGEVREVKQDKVAPEHVQDKHKRSPLERRPHRKYAATTPPSLKRSQ
jgi:23S rRNA pseudouridine2605 synthase